MRLAMRRTVGVGGAAAVALGAMFALALPASAHTHSQSAQCYGDNIQYQVDLENYATGKDKHGDEIKNSVNITDETTGTVVANEADFGSTFVKNFPDAADDATVQHTFKITVVAGDDPDGSQGFSYTHEDSAGPCVTTPPPSSTTTPPPPPSSTTTAPPTTTTAVVAAATTTNVPPGAGELASTGVNAGFPLAIAGALVIIGGGILFWLRYNARKGKA
ncbi:MAG TPA: hypothetical protein VFW65_34365 [Pseudonocardiaceae bacterium]|nr:hypothetical protein [Pseudonocardiaceae bacterium]